LEGEGDLNMLSDPGVAAAGESRDEADGDGREVILGIVSGEGGRARAGETDGTRLIEVPLGRRL
jgi:hypothetical protein